MFYRLIFLFVLIIIMSVTPAFATIWQVSNTGSPGADFDNVQAAHDAASAGDTIYVHGSSHDYGGFTLSKKLFIYGPGYFLSENSETQAYTYPAMIRGDVSFNSGSDGSLMTGLDIYVWNPYEEIVWIDADSVVIKRNFIRGAGDTFYCNDNIIATGDNRKGIIITGNYLELHYNDDDSNEWPHTIKIGENNSYIYIANNYLDSYAYWSDREAIYSPPSTDNIIVTNNVIRRTLKVYNAVVQNNILREGNFTGEGNIVTNNIGDNGQFGSDNGNFTASMDSIFVGSGSTDGKWQLREGSPAIGAGTPTGTDIGMFGGPTPYVLSGMPDIPAVYFFNAPAVVTPESGLPVEVKIKAHN